MNISNIFPWGAHVWQTAIVSAIGNTAVLYNITGTLAYLQQILAQVGPMLSAVLFIIAGVFYAVGQMLPPDKKANFHTTSVNIIIGAIVVAVLSVTSSGLALASTHLLVNMSINATANAIR